MTDSTLDRLFQPGGPFFVDGSGRNTMRLTFAKESDDRIREGVGRLAEQLGLELAGLLARTERIVHGTTVATNALLERKGA